ncbi:MAG: cupredoxin domain-containing protein [Planctomycetota bacterium]
MDAPEIVVLIGGVMAMAFVLLFFFGPRRQTRAAPAAGGVQQVRVTVKGGYSPDVIAVRAGRPVRLEFYRDETASCSAQVRLPDFGIVRDLPAFETTPIEFTPEKPGEYTFTCGMQMLRGKLIVEE